jgi:DNA invertase Pin-like site-specific DNA recombinase
MTTVGYARVSTDGQSLEGQRAALTAAGADRIFAASASGAKSDCKEPAKALATLGTGDVLVVTRLDRLARSTRDLLNVLAAAAESLGNSIVIGRNSTLDSVGRLCWRLRHGRRQPAPAVDGSQ